MRQGLQIHDRTVACPHFSFPSSLLLQQAVLHCFFKSRGYTQSECVLLEMLVEAQSQASDTAGDLRTVISKRILWELETSPMEELVELILNTRATVRRLQHNNSLNDQQRSVCGNFYARIQANVPSSYLPCGAECRHRQSARLKHKPYRSRHSRMALTASACTLHRIPLTAAPDQPDHVCAAQVPHQASGRCGPRHRGVCRLALLGIMGLRTRTIVLAVKA